MEAGCKVYNGKYMFDTYMAEWYYINRSATDRRLALIKFLSYKSNRQSLQARAVIFVSYYCLKNLLSIQAQIICTSIMIIKEAFLEENMLKAIDD